MWQFKCMHDLLLHIYYLIYFSNLESESDFRMSSKGVGST